MATTVQPTAARKGGFGFDSASMTPVHWTVGVLSAVTGAIHLYLYATEQFLPFLVAGVVFFAAVAGLLLNVYRRALYALGVPFTAGQIVLWYLQGMPSGLLGIADKVVQVVLIALLVFLLVTERRPATAR